jgi:hypothetical protein
MMKQLSILLFLFTFSLPLLAQVKPAPVLKQPDLTSFWGFTKGGELPLEMVLNLIDSTVWVMDDKKVKYSINRYILLYRSKDRFEDEETGLIKSRFNSTSYAVKNSGFLEERWRKSLYEIIKKEDELWITDVIVRDKRGEYYKAPDIKITVR